MKPVAKIWLVILAVVLCGILVWGALMLPTDAADRWDIDFSGDRNNKLRMDGYIEIYSEDDTIIFRRTFENVSTITFDGTWAGLLNGVRIEYGVRPTGTLYTPTAAPDNGYWIYCAGAFSVSLAPYYRNGSPAISVFQIAGLNAVRDTLAARIGRAGVETPAEYTPEYYIPISKGILDTTISSSKVTTTTNFSSGYFENGREFEKNIHFTSDGYIVTALDVSSIIADGLTLSSDTTSWNFKRGFAVRGIESTTETPEITLPDITFPSFSDGDIAAVWADATDNDLFNVILVPVLTFMAFGILGAFVIFGRRE